MDCWIGWESVDSLRMMLRMSEFRAAVMAIVSLLAFAGTVAAAEVGDDLSHAPEAWSAGTVIAQARNTDATGTTFSGVRAAGVLTSVSVRTQGNAGTVKVLLLRKTGDPNATSASMLNVGPTIPIDVPAAIATEGVITTIPQRRQVQIGDRFGLVTVFGIRALWIHPSVDQDYCWFAAEPHADDSTVVYSNSLCNNTIPLVRGTVETDIDADGYGDETQDLCPVDPARQTECTADLSIKIKRASRPRPGLRALLMITVTNKGPSPARNVSVRLDRARKLRSFGFPLGACSAVSARLCNTELLAPGEKATFTARAIKRKSGMVRMTARVTSDAVDPLLTNNKSSTTVKFKR